MELHDIEHDSSRKPVEGCEKCDKEIGRPIKKRFGDGSSEQVIPRTIKGEAQNEQ